MTKVVTYLGPPGTFSEEAALLHAPSATLRPCPTVRAAINTVETHQAGEAVIAIENSIEGSVTDNLDLLIHDTRLLICKELVLPITQCLLAQPGTRMQDIKVVFSHPQPLGQCRRFLEQRLPSARPVASLSTIAAVEDMQRYGGPAAAIAPRRAAQLYGAEVLAAAIQDSADNVTRFVVLAAKDHPPTGDDKTSIAFYLEDRPGALYRAVKGFADRTINLSKIESRPAKQSLGKYVFLLDFERHREDADAKEALAELAPLTTMLKVFGSYPRFRDRR